MSLFFFGQQRYGAGGSLSSPVSGLSRRRSSHFPSGIVAATISDPAAIMSTMTIRPRARTPRSALIERASSGVQRSEGSAVAAHVWLATMVRLRAAGLQLLLLRTLRHTQEANGASAKIRKRCAGGGIPAQRFTDTRTANHHQKSRTFQNSSAGRDSSQRRTCIRTEEAPQAKGEGAERTTM